MNQLMAAAEAKPQSTLGYKTFQNRKTAELVFAFVEPIGGNAKQVQDALIEIIQTAPYNYAVNQIRMSSIIQEEAVIQNIPLPEEKTNLSQKARGIRKLQELGNRLREKNGTDFLAKQAIRKIAQYRRDNGGFEVAEEGAIPNPKPLRVVHIIRSLKNDAELELLRAIYGTMLTLVAVSGNYTNRFKNYFPASSPTVTDSMKAENEFEILTRIDQDEGIAHGQRVRKVFHKADLFLAANDQTAQEVRRYLELLFDLHIHSPTCEEVMMFEAFAASLRSTCLSRQVGAAIATKQNDLLAVGWNDIPRFGGGLATENHTTDKCALCLTKGHCNTNGEIDKLASGIYDILQSKNVLIKKTTKGYLTSILKETELANLLEFSRAIHAEMEAISNAARNGKNDLRESTLYVTTYPCENCVKHILACGISNVIYIEPYPKSRANTFFSEFIADRDSVTGRDTSGKNDKLMFSQFSGISPKSYSRLFKMDRERKDGKGKLVVPDALPMPRSNVFVDSFTLYEMQIEQDLLKEVCHETSN